MKHWLGSKYRFFIILFIFFRVHLAETISPAYVKEAGRLLSNSILKVEKPQLDIEEEFDQAREEHVLEGDKGGENIIVIIKISASF